MSTSSSQLAASLEALPPEILIPIVTRLPGLDILWDLMTASPHVWRLFNDHAITIVECILSGPNAVIPPEIAELTRAVILVRSRAVPFESLNEFQGRFLRKVGRKWKGSNMEAPPRPSPDEKLSPGCLSAAMPPVEVLRSVVATTHQISVLSQACLTSFLDRLRDPSFRPLHLTNPQDRYDRHHRRGPIGEYIEAWDQVFTGEPVSVVDVGQPTWVEEMRVVRALWYIQLVGEMHHQIDCLEWSDQDIEGLKDMNPGDDRHNLGSPYPLSPEEVRSVMGYLVTLKEAKQDLFYRLPRPPRCERWTTALPIRGERYMEIAGYRDDGSPIKRSKFTEDRLWGRTPVALDGDAPGMSIFECLTNPPSHPTSASPLEGIKFDSFRPFGLAIWDAWRMHHLGLHSSILEGQRRLPYDAFYFFAWESILPPDEVASVKSNLRARKKRDAEERQAS
ncbi:uncharacterized protein FSUBG_2277 [Fusarium subglutinans]|uniref:F-box domain-containing protein n=1 Tax=Gibberella subglutinans TaxID=42677 RepID=A0A8H5QAX9_GIBSU|nr:uncharacterized protein FSUBG_2277 [Fusarium subglutinans]KAF5611444.1 hypothetical protein FSUBG_2277 [Fusarium subglutinans]